MTDERPQPDPNQCAVCGGKGTPKTRSPVRYYTCQDCHATWKIIFTPAVVLGRTEIREPQREIPT